MPQYCYLPESYATERELAYRIARQLNTPCQSITPITDGVDEFQAKAVHSACTKNISILRGLPGAGKTRTLARIIASFAKAGMRGIVMCPAAIASKRAARVINDMGNIDGTKPKCMTMHKGLAYNPKRNGFGFDATNKLPLDYVVLDEGTMAGSLMFLASMQAIDPRKTRIVVSGDSNQLPSVEPGKPFTDMIQTGIIPDTYLTRIYRQGAESGIVHNAKRTLDGSMPSVYAEDGATKYRDFGALEVKQEDAVKTILQYATERLPAYANTDPVQGVQVISLGKKGDVGVENLGSVLREKLNPKSPSRKERNGFRVGDKVINRKNDPSTDLSNGDVGIVVDVGEKGVSIQFDKDVGTAGTGLIDVSAEYAGSNIQNAFCSTVHAMQGSEAPVVVMPVYSTHYMLLSRNIVYTGQTRPKQVMLIVYEKRAMKRAVSTCLVDSRRSNLSPFILQAAQHKTITA